MGQPKLSGQYRRVEVHVTQEIIEKSQRRSSSHCMVAEAIRGAVPEARMIGVDLQTIRFTDPEKGARYIYLTPPRAQQAIVDFDQGIATEPFSFWLYQASQVVRAGVSKTPDGKKKRASRARQGVVRSGGTGSAPVVLGGEAPPVAALANSSLAKGHQRQLLDAETNATLATGSARQGRRRGAPRQFGLRQLRP